LKEKVEEKRVSPKKQNYKSDKSKKPQKVSVELMDEDSISSS